MKIGELPPRVKSAIERLREEQGIYIEAKYRKKSFYYLFSATSRFEKETKKRRKITRYIGRMDNDGRFIAARHHATDFMQYLVNFMPRPALREFERLRERYPDAYVAKVEKNRFYVYSRQGNAPQDRPVGIIQENGSINVPAGYEGEAMLSNAMHVTGEEQMVLRGLSMNARMPFSRLGRLAGITEHLAYSRAKSLEKRFGMEYILELDVLKLGYAPFFVLIKFTGNVPSSTVISEALQNEPKIQFAATVKGDYDLIIYLVEDSSENVGDTVWRIRSSSQLRSYDAVWYISPFDQTYGLIPLRQEFFEKLLKLKEKKRGVEASKQERPGLLLSREIAVLAALNSNSKEEFSSIDKKTGYGRGASQYTYYRLQERGIIQRCTITMKHLPIRYISIILIDFTNVAEYASTRRGLLTELIQNRGVINKYCLIGDFGTPNGGLLVMPILGETDLDDTMDHISTNLKGIKASTLVVTDTIIGSLCYRIFDDMYSKQYARLEEAKLVEPKAKVGYD
ncbi:MAG: hypothetical protein KGH72_01665 [Candidatus Micrarchaeota archaeon]|nr:hypothetical protein [Candidatus Micrarchaeota archaeon]